MDHGVCTSCRANLRMCSEWMKNSLLLPYSWHWAKQPSGSISLPDFIQLRAKGEAKTHNGHVYLKKPGPDSELQALLQQRIEEAQAIMNDAITKKLYGDYVET